MIAFTVTKLKGRKLTGNTPHGSFEVVWDAEGQLLSESVQIRDPEQPETQQSDSRQITPAKVASFVEAMLTAPRVSPETEQERLAICASCDKRKTDKDGIDFCGLCGCKVSSEGWRVTNLASYEENLPKWGCKHPLRGYTDPTGKKLGWPAS